MLNHITIMGRLTRDPELKRTGSGIAVASFSLAVDRDFGKNENGEKEVDFIDCTAWRQTAEFVSKYFAKGRMAVVSGKLQTRVWTDKDGNKRKSTEVVADNCYFGDSKPSGSQGGYSAPTGGNACGGGYSTPAAAPAPSYGSYQAPVNVTESQFSMLEDDDAQLPF